MFIPTRRKFLSIAARSIASLGAGSVMLRYGALNALASNTPNYKALVCIDLLGGNDSNNSVVPVVTPQQSYAAYLSARGQMAIAQGALQIVGTKNGATYGLHPRLVEIKNLYAQNKAAILANVGMLVQPTTRAQYQGHTAPVPNSLFSHSDQQNQWQSAYPGVTGSTGWAGRAADVMAPINAPSTCPMIITPASCGLFCTGQQTAGAMVPYNSTLGLQNMPAGSARQLAHQQLLSFDNGLSLVQASNSVVQRGINDAALLSTALSAAPTLQTVFPATGLGGQLAEVAKIISVRTGLGMNRQIFFCSLNGFDTHSGQLPLHDSLLMELSQAINAFYQATVELGVDSQVTTFTMSEFGRTLQPSSNGGTDHAWGGHHFVVGGAVQGGDMYGQFPTLAFNGPDDATNRGAWIPTTSVEQYGATLATWFGLSQANLPAVFPNIGNFGVTNLGFLG